MDKEHIFAYGRITQETRTRPIWIVENENQQRSPDCKMSDDFSLLVSHNFEQSGALLTHKKHISNDNNNKESFVFSFMCWSAQVSFRFACLDTVFVALLLARKYFYPKQKGHAGKYAALMTGITLQEWAQYFIWKRNHLDSCSEATDVFLSMLAVGGAESLPFSLIVASTRETTVTRHRLHMRNLALFLWVTQLLIVIISAVYTGKYCVELGKNHHQAWVCESAVHAAGGQRLHAVFYWFYICASLCSSESVDMPSGERRRLQGIGLASGTIAYAMYATTLEACSIWCWSAFVMGICFCAQEYRFVEAMFLDTVRKVDTILCTALIVADDSIAPL